MKLVGLHERTVPISRYGDPELPTGGLTTSVVALVTDVVRNGVQVIGYGFSSFGRYGQGGLIRERLAPRLLTAPVAGLLNDEGSNLDPMRTWDAMMTGEKPGGHGDRSVAVGTIDMAVWDAAAKIAGLPLYRFVVERIGRSPGLSKEGGHGPLVRVYAGGGYPYPRDDVPRLREEVCRFLEAGYTHVKIKIGAGSIDQDIRRIETVLAVLPDARHLAVDAMNRFDRAQCLDAVARLTPLGLWWIEDICDPLDFDTQALVAERYGGAIAAGEALFSLAEARLLARYGGLRPDRDILLFDPVHCAGLTHFLRIVAMFEGAGWPRSAFWPHGGHLFSLHVAAALGLGGCEMNPEAFAPFAGPVDDARVEYGGMCAPESVGIGFEAKPALCDLLTRGVG